MDGTPRITSTVRTAGVPRTVSLRGDHGPSAAAVSGLSAFIHGTHGTPCTIFHSIPCLVPQHYSSVVWSFVFFRRATEVDMSFDRCAFLLPTRLQTKTRDPLRGGMKDWRGRFADRCRTPPWRRRRRGNRYPRSRSSGGVTG